MATDALTASEARSAWESVVSTAADNALPMEANTSRTKIENGHSVLLEQPNGDVRLVHLKPDLKVIHLGRYGSFASRELIGKQYGVTLEISMPSQTTDDSTPAVQSDAEVSEDAVAGEPPAKKPRLADVKGKGRAKQSNAPRPLGTLRRLKVSTAEELDEITDATNELIQATGAKTLSTEKILAMKAAGASGREIVDRQIAEHEAFALKNEYSKLKYTKRKESKYLKHFTPLPPTAHNIAQYQFEVDAARTRFMRPDTLSQIVSLGNIRPGSRALVFDETNGLLTGCVLGRLGGSGSCLLMHTTDGAPAMHLLPLYNLPEPYTSSEVYRNMHWGLTTSTWQPAEFDRTEAKSAPHRTRLKKRAAAQDTTQQLAQEWKDGGFDSLIVSSQFEPISVIKQALPALDGSAQIVIHSHILEPLTAAMTELMEMPDILNPTILEPWMRQYQVLPGRMHPEMNGIGHGGYILHATRVFNELSIISGKGRESSDINGSGNKPGGR